MAPKASVRALPVVATAAVQRRPAVRAVPADRVRNKPNRAVAAYEDKLGKLHGDLDLAVAAFIEGDLDLSDFGVD